MHDILVPAEPADLIDRIIALQLRIDALPAAPPPDLSRRYALLATLATRIMPTDAAMADLMGQLQVARSDIASLTLDLRACEARKDYGTGFIAMAQGLLAALIAVDHTKEAINRHVATRAADRSQAH